jgi:soluble lytic murein transglycosylase-like protein
LPVALFLILWFACARSAHADCIDAAAARHGVNPLVLRAIGWQESHLDTAAVGINVDGSTDLGAFQINSRHLPLLARFGIDATALRDGCTNAEVAAWHYRRMVDRHGNTWAAVGAYHSATPNRAAVYADRIAAILMRWSALPNGPLPSGAPAPSPPPPASPQPAATGAARVPMHPPNPESR